LALVACYETDRHWMTPWERSSARAAMMQIDELQDSASLSDEEFEVRKQVADAKVKSAGQSAITHMDKQIHLRLELCLGGVELERNEAASMRLLSERDVQPDQKVKAAEVFALKKSSARNIYRDAFHELHKALD
jgi:hypothetical protein